MPGLLPRARLRKSVICLSQIVPAHARQPGHRAVALEMIEMAAGAADRAIGTHGTLGDILRRSRLSEIGPRLGRKILRDIEHILALQRGSDRLHDVALAVAPLEIAQLDIDVAGLLSPDGGDALVHRLAVGAMAAGANLGLFFDTLCMQRRRGGIQDGHQDDSSEYPAV